MKPNNCLFLAAKTLCLHQFGIDISEAVDVFDKYNTGDGILFARAVNALDEALSRYGIFVSAVYGNIDGDFSHRDKVVDDDFVPFPFIAFYKNEQHAEARLSGASDVCSAAIKLHRK